YRRRRTDDFVHRNARHLFVSCGVVLIHSELLPTDNCHSIYLRNADIHAIMSTQEPEVNSNDESKNEVSNSEESQKLSTAVTEDDSNSAQDSQTITATTDTDKTESQSEDVVTSGETVSFKLVFNKTKYDIEFPLDNTIKQLKEHLTSIINVLPAMQKVMIKGLAKDEKTLRELGVAKGSKVMVVGSKLDDLVSVCPPKTDASAPKETTTITSSKEPLSKQKIHRKILDKGLPDDVMPGIKNIKESLPACPLSGMVNKHGGKVRLTFKLELDQVWIGTKERTEKINMNHIRQVVSEPIEGFDQYHIVGLQLGPTEASRYWIYWVPAQYVDAIKDTVLGK
ncbi:unnamed protein product, partial [Meganyctiphanes norvegica]